VNAIVIGAGLFGSLIARGLRNAGCLVTVVDSREPMAGSPPAACLIKPEWVKQLPKEVFDTGMAFLRSNYEVEEVSFHQQGTAFWVDPSTMIRPRPLNIEGRVLNIEHDKAIDKWVVAFLPAGNRQLHVPLHADIVVIAAGIWSQPLVDKVMSIDLGLTGKAGTALLFQDRTAAPFIRPWAPYKQIVGFNRRDSFWVSDGTAIIPENYTEVRKAASILRCEWEYDLRRYGKKRPFKFNPIEFSPYKTVTGIRPYSKREPCWCDQIKRNLWVATGARKNGTLLGAWCADKIMRSL